MSPAASSEEKRLFSQPTLSLALQWFLTHTGFFLANWVNNHVAYEAHGQCVDCAWIIASCSLQCRRILWAHNLVAKAPRWNLREEEMGRVSKGYYFYSPQSSTVIKSKMAATTILRTRTRFRPPKIRLHCRLSELQTRRFNFCIHVSWGDKSWAVKRAWWEVGRFRCDWRPAKFSLLQTRNSIFFL